jgi:hypothetical protein
MISVLGIAKIQICDATQIAAMKLDQEPASYPQQNSSSH